MTGPSPDEQLARDLWTAVENKDLTRVRALLSEGADPNHPLFWSPEWTSRGGIMLYPPLHLACWRWGGDLSVVKALVEAGADYEREDGKDHDRPIHAACRSDNKEVVQYLVEDKNCSLVDRNEQGLTPLEVAIRGGSFKVALYLINRGCGGDEEKARLLCKACYQRKIDIVKELVEKRNIDPTIARDDKGRSPLDRALDDEWGAPSLEVALYLVNRGCGGDEEKARLLCEACNWWEINVVKELVEKHYIDPTIARDDKGRSPLDRALDNDLGEPPLELALYLINRGCGGDEEKARLLCLASYWGKINVVKELVEKHNIDPTIARDGKGRSPLDRALDDEYEEPPLEVALYLINNGCGSDEEKARLLCEACYCGKIDIVKELVEKHSIDLTSARDKHGSSPLEQACICNNKEVVQYLVEDKNCSLVDRTKEGLTPLEVALKECGCEVALYLINRGCGGDEEKARLLCEACDWGEIDIVKELVEKHNIDPTSVTGIAGKTPLEIATSMGHTAIVDYLNQLQQSHTTTRIVVGQKRSLNKRDQSTTRPPNKPETRRECPSCHDSCHIRCKKCPGCGLEFPPSKKNKATKDNPLKNTASLLQKLQKKIDQLSQNGYDVAVLVHKFDSEKPNARHNYRQYSTPGPGSSFLEDTNVLDSWRQHCSRRELVIHKKTPAKRKRGGRSHDQRAGSHEQPSRSHDQDSGPSQNGGQRSHDQGAVSHDPPASMALPWPLYSGYYPPVPGYLNGASVRTAGFPQTSNPGLLFPRPFMSNPSSQYFMQ